jgi:hypothetical protein
MRLLLDECSGSHTLHAMFELQGHDVTRVQDVLQAGATDAVVFRYAKTDGSAIVTRSYSDFQALHEAEPDHAGLFVDYADASGAHLTAAEIALAIRNVSAIYPDGISGLVLDLRAFRNPQK